MKMVSAAPVVEGRCNPENPILGPGGPQAEEVTGPIYNQELTARTS
jgi:hypothetical protein